MLKYIFGASLVVVMALLFYQAGYKGYPDLVRYAKGIRYMLPGGGQNPKIEVPIPDENTLDYEDYDADVEDEETEDKPKGNFDFMLQMLGTAV